MKTRTCASMGQRTRVIHRDCEQGRDGNRPERPNSAKLSMALNACQRTRDLLHWNSALRGDLLHSNPALRGATDGNRRGGDRKSGTGTGTGSGTRKRHGNGSGQSPAGNGNRTGTETLHRTTKLAATAMATGSVSRSGTATATVTGTIQLQDRDVGGYAGGDRQSPAAAARGAAWRRGGRCWW